MNTQKFADETAKQTLFHYKGAHCKFDNLGVNVKWHEGSIFAKLFITWLLLYYSHNVWNKYDNHYNKRPSGHIAHLSNNSHNFDNISLDSLRFSSIKSYVKKILRFRLTACNHDWNLHLHNLRKLLHKFQHDKMSLRKR